ncbi:hypothetical protein [Inhella sp.]|uniref:hypothetical protein n=1 Tax=Inhella sp. TaxID=1921806 RepID=UPI0035B36615
MYMINRDEQDAVVLGSYQNEFWIFVFTEKLVVRSHINHVKALNGKVYVFNGTWSTPVDQVLSDFSTGNRTLFHACRDEAELKRMNDRLNMYVRLLLC